MKQMTFAAAFVLASLAPVPAQDAGLPADGKDVVLLTDGRKLRCVVGPEAGGRLALEVHGKTLLAPRNRIARIRFFKDFDPAPRDESEKQRVESGQVRWEGRWVPKEQAQKLRDRELEQERRQREEDDQHSPWENRWQVETAHFKIDSNLPKSELDFYKQLLEDYYGHFTKEFKIRLTQRERKRKLPVLLYRDHEQYWKKYKEDNEREGEHTLGYFIPVPGSEKLVLFARPGSRAEALPVLFHEGTHYILHLANQRVLLPRWVHEGCAEYYAAAIHQGSKFVPGQVQDGRLLHFQEMIQANQFIPFDKLIRAGNPGPKDEQIAFEAPHYAQAWTFVHFLFSYKNGKYRAGFLDYLERWIEGKGVKYEAITGSDRKFVLPADDQALLLRCLGQKNFDKLKDELIAYARELPMRSARAYVDRGELRLYQGRHQEANQDFAMALERGGQDVDVLRSLALIPTRTKEAPGLLERALELDPFDVAARYHYAHLKPKETTLQLRICAAIEPDNGRVLSSLAWMVYRNDLKGQYRVKSAGDQKLLREGLALAERAVANDPASENLDTLAAYQMLEGKFAEARQTMHRAVQQDPEGRGYLERLACAHALLGEPMEFAKALRRIEVTVQRYSQEERSPEEEQRISPGVGDPNRIPRALRDTVQYAMSWEKPAEGAKALHAWYANRPPKALNDWLDYVQLLRRGGLKPQALEAATKALQAFPYSEELKAAQGVLSKEGN